MYRSHSWWCECIAISCSFPCTLHKSSFQASDVSNAWLLHKAPCLQFRSWWPREWHRSHQSQWRYPWQRWTKVAGFIQSKDVEGKPEILIVWALHSWKFEARRSSTVVTDWACKNNLSIRALSSFCSVPKPQKPTPWQWPSCVEEAEELHWSHGHGISFEVGQENEQNRNSLHPLAWPRGHGSGEHWDHLGPGPAVLKTPRFYRRWRGRDCVKCASPKMVVGWNWTPQNHCCRRILLAQAGSENYGFGCNQNAVNFLSGALSPSTATWICNLISAIYLEDTPHMDKIIGCIWLYYGIRGYCRNIRDYWD